VPCNNNTNNAKLKLFGVVSVCLAVVVLSYIGLRDQWPGATPEPESLAPHFNASPGSFNDFVNLDPKVRAADLQKSIATSAQLKPWFEATGLESLPVPEVEGFEAPYQQIVYMGVTSWPFGWVRFYIPGSHQRNVRLNGFPERVLFLVDTQPALMSDDYLGLWGYAIIKSRILNELSRFNSGILFNVILFDGSIGQQTLNLFRPEMIAANPTNRRELEAWLAPINTDPNQLGPG
jgi:hypothetical protein